ncbi:hypothetical protein D1872_248960 [compost metagenome]
MSYQNSISSKFQELLQDWLDLRCILDHFIIDIRQLLNVIWNPFMRIHKGSETVHFLAFNHFNSSDFNDFTLRNRETGGFNVKNDIGRRLQIIRSRI